MVALVRKKSLFSSVYLLYVDESGDVGLVNSPNKYFVLSAIVVHESTWQNFLDDLVIFRRGLKEAYGLRMRDEIHAAEFVTGKPDHKVTIPRNLRVSLLKKCLLWLSARTDISVYSVVCKKTGKDRDIFEFTWRTLIQRFENTINHKNFPGPNLQAEKGILLCDNTDGNKLTKLLREMRRYNQVPSLFGGSSYNAILRSIIEDPIFRDSKLSYLHQMVDVVSYFARQHYEPNKTVRRYGAKNFYGLLGGVLNQYVVKKKTNPYHMVVL